LCPFDITFNYLAISSLDKSMFDPVNKQTTFFPVIVFLILFSPATAKAPEG